jgi:hypothetical protein
MAASSAAGLLGTIGFVEHPAAVNMSAAIMLNCIAFIDSVLCISFFDLYTVYRLPHGERTAIRFFKWLRGNHNLNQRFRRQILRNI